MKSICCRFKVTLSSRLLLHSKFRLFLSGFLLFTSPSLLPVLASGNRGSLYHHPTSRGYVSGPCAALQSFLAGILPCVDFACGFLALLICWHVVHPLCPGNSQCSTEWLLPGVWSFSPATAESQLLLALGWGLPILYCGHPHPHPLPTHKLLSHCSQHPSISVSGNHGDCGGGRLSQAPSVSSPDLLPFIPFCSRFVLSLGDLKVAPPWFCGGSGTKVPSFLRSWNLIGTQVSVLISPQEGGQSPQGLFLHLAFFSSFPLSASLACSRGGNFSSFLLARQETDFMLNTALFLFCD